MSDEAPWLPDLSEPLDPRERAVLRRKAIDACTLCDEDGYIGGARVCDHVDHRETNRRGMALVREALKGKPNNPAVLHRFPVSLGGEVSGSRTVEPEDDPEPDL